MNSAVSLAGIARLGYLGCIRVSGADAATFLHSQLTNDFSRLDSGQARLAGFCSAKGRLQASFIAWNGADNDIILACSADILDVTLKRLSMFVLRMKCRLSDASTELPLFGVAGRHAAELLRGCSVWGKRIAADGTAIRLPDGLGHVVGLLIPNRDRALPGSDGAPLSQDEWRWLQLLSGVPTIEARTVDLFVPQMINFDLLGGVDFHKGCYPGQEVVARSQYRGTLKRRMFLFDCAASASAGQEIYSLADPGQPAGVVVNAVPMPAQSGSTLLVELKLALLDAGPLHLGHVTGPLMRRRELPYPVSAAEASVG